MRRCCKEINKNNETKHRYSFFFFPAKRGNGREPKGLVNPEPQDKKEIIYLGGNK